MEKWGRDNIFGSFVCSLCECLYTGCGARGGGREEAFLSTEEGQGMWGFDHHNEEEEEEKRIMEEKEEIF